MVAPCGSIRLPLTSRMIAQPPAPPAHRQRQPAILSLIGNTPLVEITRIDTGPCQLFVKLENQNPTGSIKDRVALAMVEAAERE
jgi:cystathionine beta-synthase